MCLKLLHLNVFSPKKWNGFVENNDKRWYKTSWIMLDHIKKMHHYQQSGHMCMIIFVVCWPLFCLKWKLIFLIPRACSGHVWMNKWCGQGCLNMISMCLWLMLQVWMTMQFITFMMVIPMFPWRERNVHVSTIGKELMDPYK